MWTRLQQLADGYGRGKDGESCRQPNGARVTLNDTLGKTTPHRYRPTDRRQEDVNFTLLWSCMNAHAPRCISISMAYYQAHSRDFPKVRTTFWEPSALLDTVNTRVPKNLTLYTLSCYNFIVFCSFISLTASVSIIILRFYPQHFSGPGTETGPKCVSVCRYHRHHWTF